MTRWESANPERDSTVPLPFHSQPTPLPRVYRPRHEEFLEAPALAARTCQLARASGIVVAAGHTVAASVLRPEDVPQRVLVLVPYWVRQADYILTTARLGHRPAPLQSPLTPPPPSETGHAPRWTATATAVPTSLFAIQQRPHKLPRHHRSHLTHGPPLHDPAKKDQRKPARVSPHPSMRDCSFRPSTRRRTRAAQAAHVHHVVPKEEKGHPRLGPR